MSGHYRRYLVETRQRQIDAIERLQRGDIEQHVTYINSQIAKYATLGCASLREQWRKDIERIQGGDVEPEIAALNEYIAKLDKDIATLDIEVSP